MAESLGIFDQRLLDGTVETIYTVPADHTFVPKTISVTNYSAASATVTIWLVAPTDSNTDKNMILKEKNVFVSETIFLNTDIYLQAGYKIMVQASAASALNFQLSGVDMWVEVVPNE